MTLDSILSKIKVLIVEDDRLIAENSAMMLETLGYQVSKICNNSADALEFITQDPPDIVLVDIILKGAQDGIIFANTLRQDHDIPFVYVTATSDENILERAKVTSPYGYIIKPFNERDLHSNIEMALYKFKSESKMELLNEMLYVLNDINRVSDEIQDEAGYLNLLCETLINFPSFSYVWTGLFNDDMQVGLEIKRGHEDLAEDVSPLNIDGTLSHCISTVLDQSLPVVGTHTHESCGECRLGEHFVNKPIVSARIGFEDQIYGILSAVVLPRMPANEEFLHLFSELANKVGSRIHALRSKKQVGKAKSDLARSEERFNRFAEIANDIIVVHDSVGIINYLNPSTAELLEMPYDEVTNHPLEKFIAPRSLPEFDERKRVRQRGETGTLRYDMFVISSSGEEIPIEVSSNPILEQGETTNYLLIGRDMRERRLQDAQLKKLSSVVEQSPAAILITDSQGLITYVNPKFTTMTGYIKEDVIGEFPELLNADGTSTDIAADLVEKTKEGDWRGELETTRSNGEKFWVNATISSLTNEDGRFSYIGIIEDISEKKHAALELERSKQSYEDIFKSTSDAIFILDQDGIFIDVNQGAMLMYDQERSYLIGKKTRDLSADGYNDLDEVRSAYRRAYRGTPQRFEFWGKRKSGEAFPKEVQVNKVHYFGREVLLATARDISDRKKFEEDLREAVKKARKSDEVKGYFLANMSHEIRTPLTSIVGYIDLIFARIQGHLSEQDLEYFDIIRRNSDRLTRAVHSIIDLSQIEAGATTLDAGLVNLTILTENIFVDHKVEADGKGLDFIYHRPEKPFWMSGDKGLLHTAITNLVDNAINYTEQGRVDIFLTGEDDGTCLLEIRDTGIGIAKKSLNSIFDSFNQESMGYTKDYQGLGLGLTISKKNFELHDIKIEVESEKGKGSSFFVRFPKYDTVVPMPPVEDEVQEEKVEHPSEPVETDKKPQDPVDAGPSLKNILIVEDDENAQRLFGLFLKNSYNIHFATTVKEGRECIEANPIDLVVTDLSLVGGEDGLVLVDWVRHHTNFSNVPIIALTAHAFISDRDRCLEAGCNDFITKPVFRSQLLEIIEKNISS